MSRGWQWSREGEARPVRTCAWTENLANGGRSRGRAAVRGEDETDGWGLPVSVLQREGRRRVQRVGRLGPKPSGPAVGAVTFSFFFYAKL
jgi:hypothetical protein